MWAGVLNFYIKLSIWIFQGTKCEGMLEIPSKANSSYEIPLTKQAQKVSNDLLVFLKSHPQYIWLEFQMLH